MSCYESMWKLNNKKRYPKITQPEAGFHHSISIDLFMEVFWCWKNWVEGKCKHTGTLVLCETSWNLNSRDWSSLYKIWLRLIDKWHCSNFGNASLIGYHGIYQACESNKASVDYLLQKRTTKILPSLSVSKIHILPYSLPFRVLRKVGNKAQRRWKFCNEFTPSGAIICKKSFSSNFLLKNLLHAHQELKVRACCVFFSSKVFPRNREDNQRKNLRIHH